MPKNVDSFNACIESKLREFTNYDRAVDIVSGFEAYCNNSDIVDQLVYFDRFPIMANPVKMTPDFAVLFDDYGLIFEISVGSPFNNTLENKLKQLKKYDEHFKFKCNSGDERITPSTQDIVLILDSRDADEMFINLNQKIEQTPEFHFNNNLIFLHYTFRSEESYYFIKKFSGNNNSFRDNSLPTKTRFENVFHGGRKMSFSPRHFKEHKAKSNLCNDQPPDIYTSVFLWNKIFYEYLSYDQRINLSKGSSRNPQDIDLNIDRLVKNINDNYIKNGNVRTKWIIKAMKLLEKADLAEFVSNKDVIIHFHNFRRLPSRGPRNEAALEHDRPHDMARIIAEKYCNNINSNKKIRKGRRTQNNPNIPKPTFRQKSIQDYIQDFLQRSQKDAC